MFSIIFTRRNKNANLWFSFYWQWKYIVDISSTIIYQRLNGTNFEKNSFKGVLEDITRTELDSIFQGELKSDQVIAKKEELIGIGKEFNNTIVQYLGLEKEFVVEPDMYKVLSKKFWFITWKTDLF